MKTKNLFVAILALTGVSLAATSANAQFYSQGDLLLGFRDTNTTSDYLIDLGPASAFDGYASSNAIGTSETLSVGNISADLASVFGAGWATDANLYWGVAGVGPSSTSLLYAGVEEPSANTLSTPLTENTNSTQGGAGTKINNVGNQADTFDTPSTNATDAVIQGSSEASRWATYMPGGSNSGGASAFAYFQTTFEGNSPSGITSTTLDLYKVPTGNPTNHIAGQYDGSFDVNSNGTVTFSVVPEPSTVATMVLGAGVLLFAGSRRRRMMARA